MRTGGSAARPSYAEGVSWARAVAVVGSVALCSALLVALSSRAPGALRVQEVGERVTDPGLGARFTEDQKRRAAAYNRTGYLALVLSAVVDIVLLVVLLRGPFGRVVLAYGRVPGGWLVHAVLLAATVSLLSSLVALPVGYVRGYVVEHAWGLSTQGVGAWVLDRARSAAVSATIVSVAAVAFFAVTRWQPRTWWVWGWGSFTLLSALGVFLWPVVVAPLFNRFTPLEEAALSRRVHELARRAGVDVSDVLVADASRRTTAENAYVAGLGTTKRIVLYDTLLSSGSEAETLYVVGHELGHEVEQHVPKGVAASALGLAVGFATLAWLGTRSSVLAWAGASSIADLRALPALLLFVTVASLVALPIESALSRRFESRADEIAVRLTGAPDPAIRALRRLALVNIADLDPPSVAVVLAYSHPPTPERIRAIKREAQGGVLRP
jgi:STE24 endopeptidase